MTTPAASEPRRGNGGRSGMVSATLCALAAVTFLVSGVLLASFVFSTDFAVDFDGGSHVGASANPAHSSLVLAIVGSLSGLVALILGPNRWRATSLVILVPLSGPVWLVALVLLSYYR